MKQLFKRVQEIFPLLKKRGVVMGMILITGLFDLQPAAAKIDVSEIRPAVSASILSCPTTPPNVQFKLSAPDVTTSAIQGQTGSRTENFNAFSVANLGATGSFAVGSFAKSNTGNAAVKANDVWGGSGSQYLQIISSGSVSVVLTDPSRYLGFWWAAGNANNNVTIFGSCGGNEIQLGTFTTQTVLDLLAGPSIIAVDGSSYNTGLYKRANAANEPFAYINLQLDDPSIFFTRIVFSGSLTLPELIICKY
jgi:hypothetical protein